MRNLTEEILAIPASNMDRAISRSWALEIVKDAVAVEIDTAMYPEPKPWEVQRTDDDNRVLAIVSTAYNLMADFAAEKAAQAVRKEMEEAGVALPNLSDQMMFEQNKASGVGVTSYHDLAPHSMEAVMALGEVFDHLLNQAVKQARLGLKISGALPGDDPVAALMEALGLPMPKEDGE